MTTLQRTADLAGQTYTLTCRTSAGALVTPTSTPTASMFTDTARTLGEVVLTVAATAAPYAFTVTLPATAAGTRYLKHLIPTASGSQTDADDDIAFGAVVGSVESMRYTTKERVKASLGIPDTDEDDEIEQAIDAASRYIDKRCSTTFYPVTETRTFTASNGYEVWVDDFTDPTGLVVNTGTDGTYGTTVTSGDVLPYPLNAAARGQAYYKLSVPTGVLPLSGYYATVQVTAAWGWHFVPDDIEQACLIKAAHLFRRKDSPDGVAGQSEFGVTRISRFEDPDVEMLLRPYIPIAVA